MTDAIYNEIEPFACNWLESLIAAGHIGPGVVERRSIADLTPADVAGTGQRHFFAGIGVWSAALRLAGVSDDADVWTGSCPCQPFSAAGKRSGTRDPRHLWPAWFELIRECRPAIVFGEQVASRDGLGWLDAVRADLERCGYAFGASDLCAAGVGAPHIRQRLYFVAYADACGVGQRVHVQQRKPRQEVPDTQRCSATGELADPEEERRGPRRISGPHGRSTIESVRLGASCIVGDAAEQGLTRADSRSERAGERRSWTAGRESFWSDADWIHCTDGKSRPVEPGTFPLAHGAPKRVGRLRGYGNAIVPQVAAAFIRASLDAIEDR